MADSGPLTDTQAKALLLAELIRQRKESQSTLERYWPYPKQAAFHAAGKLFRFRNLRGGNQTGKTLSAGSEVAMHLTGNYPSWWRGKVYERANNWLAGSESGELTKKGIQRILLGRDIQTERGTGTIPGASIIRHTMAGSEADLVDTVYVKHKSGGTSTIALKSYRQGRAAWQADTVDGVWYDEEPPLDVHSEGITRTNTTQGAVICTMTPLLGLTALLKWYLGMVEKGQGFIIELMIQDVDHYTDEDRAKIISQYPEHEREARAYGKPMLGSGLVYPVAREAMQCDPFAIPPHWPRVCGIDFGYEHPTAACWIAWDRDADILYVYDAYRQPGQFVPIHAAAIKARGAWIPVAWPHDGLNETAAGPALAQQYRDNGCNMLPGRAEMEPTGPDDPRQSLVSVEAGVHQILERMQTGRWRVFSHLHDWFGEQAGYHRKDGKIVKLSDDLLCAGRYGYSMRRFAITEPRQSTRFATPATSDSWRV